MYKKVDLRILNDCSMFECKKSNFKRGTVVRIQCYVNKAQVLDLFTNNVKFEITIFGVVNKVNLLNVFMNNEERKL